MKIDRDQAEFLDRMIEEWEQQQLLTPSKVAELKKSYQVKTFDWQKVAQYSIYIALACGIFALGSLLIDQEISKFLESLYNTPNIIISIGSFLIAAYLIWLGNKRRKFMAKHVFSNDAILIAGVLLIANGLAYFGKTINKNSENYAMLFLCAVPIYAYLGYRFKSRLIWAFALLSLGAWFGTQFSFVSKQNFYILGFNYPLRFVIFGMALSLLSLLIKRKHKLYYLHQTTYFIGLTYFFIALWLLSIFGNYSSISDWSAVKQINLYMWAALSLVICLICLLIGFRYKDDMLREFSVTFLLINCYSRFFEYFWDAWHKAIFFAILAATFWLIGRKAEKIWNLEFLRGEETENRESKK